MIFQLSETMKYSTKDGDFEETASIEFSPPTYSCIDEALGLRQLFTRAIAGLVKDQPKQIQEEKENDNSTLDSEAIKALLMASDIGIMEFVSAFHKLAIKTGEIASGVKLKKDHFRRISVDDNLRLVCEYIAFFVAPSLSSGEGEKKHS